MKEKGKLSRRDFLRLSAVGATGTLLAACAPEVIKETVTVKETVVVESEPETVEVEVEKVVTATPEPKGVTTIDFLTQSATPESLAELEPLISRFEEENPDIHVQFVVQPGEQDIYQKMTIMQQGGTPANMAVWGNKVAIYACAGVFKNLQPFVDRDNVDLSDYYDTHLASLKWKDDYHALPAAVYTTLLYFNKDLFDEAGVQYPPQTAEDAEDWTMDAFLETAKALTKDTDGDGEPEQFGIYEIYNNDLNKPQFYGGKSFDKEGNCTLDSPACIAAMQFWADIKFKHHVAPTAAESEGIAGGIGGDEAPFLSGRCAMAVGGNWSLPAMMGAPFNWGVAILPSSAPEGNRSANFSPDAFVMGNGPNPEEVWRFLKWIQEPENIQEWCLILGAFSPRKSQSDYNAQLVTEKFGVKGEVFNYCLSHATMVMGELRELNNPNEDEVEDMLTPYFDELELGRITAEELAEAVVDEATRLAKQPCE